MRGIGAVIHFRPPTDSSMPSPDLSGRWNSIRDWFSLPVQDEAAQCFRVFYQPDEATSPSDRLKNFLKLKALASPDVRIISPQSGYSVLVKPSA